MMSVALAAVLWTAARAEPAVDPAPAPPTTLPDPRRRSPVQTFAPKTALKISHIEISAASGGIVGDPFVRRLLAGARVGWHFSEVAAVSATALFSPDLGAADWTPLTRQILEDNQVIPQISRIMVETHGDLVFSPVHGKVAAGGRIVRFGLHAAAGPGVVLTVDDLVLAGIEADLPAQATRVQWHPTLGVGGGVRVWLTPSLTARFDVRSISYLEVIDSTSLTNPNLGVFTGGISWLLCGSPDRSKCTPAPPPRALPAWPGGKRPSL